METTSKLSTELDDYQFEFITSLKDEIESTASTTFAQFDPIRMIF